MFTASPRSTSVASHAFFLAITLMLGLMPVSPAQAADGDFIWARGIGGTAFDEGFAVTVDGSGNVYTTGYFEGTVDFDPGAGTHILTSAGAEDVFVSKVDSSGIFVWARRMGGTSIDIGRGIALDASGNVYTTGNFWGTADFNPGSGTSNLTPVGGSDIFVSKLSSSGTFLWARRMGGEDGDYGTGIAVDASGNVHTTGYFYWETVDFDPGVGMSNLTSAGAADIFISKLNSSGNFVWARRMGGEESEFGTGIDLDAAGNVHTTGYFYSNTVDFNPGAGTSNLTAAGTADIFVSKLNSSGNFVWARRMGGTSIQEGEEGLGIAVDTSGSVYTTGSFRGTADFDPGSGTSNLTSAGAADIFVSKLTSSGNFVWARRMGGAVSDYGSGIAVDASHNVYTTGSFRDTVDFDPGTGTSNLISADHIDIFVSKLNSSGNFVWARRMGGFGFDEGRGITSDTAGNVYTTGYFEGAVDFDPGAGTSNLSSAGNNGIFISKLGPLPTAPSNPGATGITQSAITWSWTDNSDNETGFKVYSDAGAAPPATLRITTATNTTSWTWGSRTVNTLYTFQVSGTNAIGDSAKTSSLSRYTQIEPVASLLVSGVGTTSITVQPSNTPSNLSAGSSAIRLANATAGTLSTWRQNSSEWVSTGLSPNRSYSFTGTSRNGDALETAPATTTVWTLAATPLSPTVGNPTGSTLDVGIAAGDGNPATTAYAIHMLPPNLYVQANGTLGASAVFQTPAVWGTKTVTGLSSETTHTFTTVARNGALVLTDVSAGRTGATLDVTPPDISMDAPSATLANAGPITYTVTYTGATSVSLAAGHITLHKTGSADGTVAVTGTGAATRTVTISGITGEGTLGVSIAAGSASDGAGNTAAAAGPSATFQVDNTAPTVSISPPSAGITRSADVSYTVTYAEASTVSLAAGDITLHKTGTADGAIAVIGTGTATRTVTISGITGDGSLSISIGAGTASDAAGNSAATTGPSATFIVDNTAPIVSISAPSASVTSSADVSYTVTYAEASTVSLAAGDITLHKTGTADGTVAVTGTGASERTVTISGITGEGTLSISIGAGKASDAPGNTAAAAGPSATFLVDNTAPTLSISAPSASVTTSADVSYTVSYAEASTVSLSTADISLHKTGSADGAVAVTGTDAATRTVTISGITGEGTLAISIGAGTASDAAGNTAAAAGPSATFIVDSIATTVSIGAPSAGITTVGPISFTVTYTGVASVSLATGDITLDKTGSADGTIAVTGSGEETRTVTISGITGDGALGISIASGTALGTVGDPAPAAGPSAIFMVDNTTPSLAFSAPSASITSGGPVTYTVTYDGADSITLADANVFLHETGTATADMAVSGTGNTGRTVTLSNIAGDGTLAIGIVSASASDSAGNSAAAYGPSGAFSVDNTAPTVSIGAPDDTLVNVDGTVSFPVTINGAASANLTSSAVTINYSGASGGAVAVLNGTTSTPTVQVAGVNGNGAYTISIPADAVSDAAGNISATAGPSASVTVDNFKPAYASFTPDRPSPTNTGSTIFTVVMTEPVVNFDSSSDLDYNWSGSSADNPTLTVNGSGDTYTVNVDTDGTGQFYVGHSSQTDIQDLAGNPFDFSSNIWGDMYFDKSKPAITISAPSAPITNDDSVSYTVAYTGADSVSLNTGHVTLNTTGTATATAAVSGSGSATCTITISGITGDGTLGISIGAGTASDAAGNTTDSTGPSATFTVDNTPPAISIGAPSANLTNSGPVTYNVTYLGEEVITLDSDDIAINGAGTASGTAVVSGSGSTRTVTLSGITGDGTLGISIATEGTATDSAGNAAPASGPSLTFSADNTMPVFSNLTTSHGEATAGAVVTLAFDASEAISGVPDVRVNGNAATASAGPANTYEYLVLPSDPLGPASIELMGLDNAGNVGLLTDNNALVIVEEENSLPLLAWPLGVLFTLAGSIVLRHRYRK